MMKIVIKPLYYYINIIKPLLNDSIMMRMVIHLKLNQLPQINNELILNKHIHLNLNNLSRMVGFLFGWFLAMSVACRSSQARDQTWATAGITLDLFLLSH